MSDDTGFDVVGDDMDLVITDVVILNKKERAMPNYLSIEPPINEGGRLSFAKRYLSYSREIPNPRFGRVAVTEIKVFSSSDKIPLGYRTLSETADDNIKPFAAKVVAIKTEPLEEAKDMVTDIVVLSGSKKENVPSGYKRLPEINGFSICYKVTKREKKTQQQTDAPSLSKTTTNAPEPNKPPTLDKQISIGVTKKIKSAIDGLTFKLNDSCDINEQLSKHVLSDLSILTLDDIENKYNFDWTLAQEQCQA